MVNGIELVNFQAITDSIWHDLMALQGRRSSIGQSHSPWAVVVPLRKHRPSRSLQAGPSESNSFLDRLERSGFFFIFPFLQRIIVIDSPAFRIL